MKGKNSLPTNKNYTEKLGKSQGNSISLDEIKRLNFWHYIEAIGGEYKPKKSSKYGRLYKWQNNAYWIRYDYKTGIYFYTSLTGTDNGTIIDFIQTHILQERNLGKVRRYISEHLHLFA